MKTYFSENHLVQRPSIILFISDSWTKTQKQNFIKSIPQTLREDSSVVIEVADFSPDQQYVVFNRCLDSNSHSFTAWIQQPVTFPAHSLKRIFEFLTANPGVEVLYGDTVSREPSLCQSRPIFSPERLRNQDYLGEIVLFSTELLRRIGGFREEANTAQLIDIRLRATLAAKKVCHVGFPVAKILRLEENRPRREDVLLVFQDHLDRLGGGFVSALSGSISAQSQRAVIGNPLVSIVIPSRARWTPGREQKHSYVLTAVKSVIEKSTYKNFEIVLVADLDPDQDLIAELENICDGKLKIVPWSKPFNFSQKMNHGVIHSAGEFVLLLNDDVEVISSQWIEAMLSLAQLPNAGMAGAMLYYEDETIQHAGHAYFDGMPTHIGLGAPRGTRGPGDGYLVEREVSGVTAACSLMPRKVFLEVGGFTALLPGNFNDVDLCLKVGFRGYDIYWTPHAELYHFESKTREAHVHYYEHDVIEHRWGLRLSDPRYWPWPPDRV